MRDFTLHRYSVLLDELLRKNYSIISFEAFLKHPPSRFIILRHDVDDKPENSLQTAIIEKQRGITSSYYFRIVKKCNDPSVLKQIADLGHEIGYHYEDLALLKGDIKKSLTHFAENLTYLRRFYPVKTICMHGSPLSKFDNKKIWDYADYHDFGIIGEPNFDIDFNSIFYLTDTGRSWNNKRFSVRDKVPDQKDEVVRWQDVPKINSTRDIIKAAYDNRLPSKILLTIHPQRWNDDWIPWGSELIWQNAKNLLKRIKVKSTT